MRSSTPILLSVTILLIVSLACAWTGVPAPTQDISSLGTAVMETMVSASTQTAMAGFPIGLVDTATAFPSGQRSFSIVTCSTSCCARYISTSSATVSDLETLSLPAVTAPAHAPAPPPRPPSANPPRWHRPGCVRHPRRLLAGRQAFRRVERPSDETLRGFDSHRLHSALDER